MPATGLFMDYYEASDSLEALARKNLKEVRRMRRLAGW